MKFAKSIAIGSLLLGLVSTAYAEGGYERAKQFQENFRNEQARLWSDDSSDQNKQQIAQEQKKESKNGKEKADN
ncbi:hypothetical protein D3C76_755960 [compost metagenome]|jgi:hypothetical protein|uniref:Secreted protein n=1 Tax=Pseudomonas sp. 13.2 TaxID=3144665 RepID=A0AAU7BCF4_9PSED|nr:MULTISPECIES: hypothetical protein [Pseudomonas]AVD93038.1 hypothetical protein C4Q27_11780 [Pseudomonas sp. SWI36]MBG6125520.1 hypothetical protein [Pseudomonas sp. M2]MCI1036033.1 hypothetical protein [Pseudomonas putida]MDH0707556.1 hypothetical protein [Pseudomonas sp. GD03862]MDM9554067.1 hypothetical protein [Pseudomonas asiatica]